MANPYLDPIGELHNTHGIPLVFYDQLGGGKSTHLPDKPASFWTMDLFFAEFECVLAHFGVSGRFDIFGHSWGGMLAADYAASRQPEGLRRLVLASAPASMHFWEVSVNKLLSRFPEDMQAMLKKHEEEGTTDAKEYQEGMQLFYGKHMCTIDPWPQTLVDSFTKLEEDMSVYREM